MKNELSDFLDCAFGAARLAGDIQKMSAQNPFEIRQKDGWANLVTEVDELCQQKIISFIEKVYPDHAILAEEEGAPKRKSAYRWIIDPIDGTTNFAHGFPFFCTTLALEKEGEILVGVVFDPIRDEMFHAVKGKGAFLNDKKLQVTPQANSAQALVATGFSYKQDMNQKNIACFARATATVQAVRRLGAAALDLSYVAAGRLEAYWDLSLQLWDMAAGALLVTEAGGKVSTCDGKKFTVASRDIVATNGPLHPSLLKIIRGQ